MKVSAYKRSEKEKDLINDLKELLDFGLKIFISSKAKSQKNNKDNYIKFNFAAIHNYCDSIYILCEQGKTHAAHVILRCVFESFVNMNYYVNNNSDLKLAKYAIWDAEENKLKKIRHFEKFINEHPNWETTEPGLTNRATLAAIKEKTNELVSAIKRANKFYKSTKIELDLRKKAEALDKKVRTKKLVSWEYNYLLIYSYFSSFAHLHPIGLENFVNEVEGEIVYDLSSGKDADKILSTTYTVYLQLLNLLKKRGIITKNVSLTVFNKKARKI